MVEAGFEDLPSVVNYLTIEKRIELRCLLKNLRFYIECPAQNIVTHKVRALGKMVSVEQEKERTIEYLFPKAATDSQTSTPIQARRAATSTCTPKSRCKKRRYEDIVEEVDSPAPCVLAMASRKERIYCKYVL